MPENVSCAELFLPSIVKHVESSFENLTLHEGASSKQQEEL